MSQKVGNSSFSSLPPRADSSGFGGAPGFTIRSSADELTVTQGQTGSLTVTVLALRGYNHKVNLTAIDLPPGVTVQFDPSSVVPSATSAATIAVSDNAPVGNHTIIIQAVSGRLSHRVCFQLNITPLELCSVKFSHFDYPTWLKTDQNFTVTATVDVACGKSLGEGIGRLETRVDLIELSSGRVVSTTGNVQNTVLVFPGNYTLTTTIRATAPAVVWCEHPVVWMLKLRPTLLVFIQGVTRVPLWTEQPFSIQVKGTQVSTQLLLEVFVVAVVVANVCGWIVARKKWKKR